MDALRQAILDGATSKVRNLLNRDSTSQTLPSPGERTILDLAQAKGVMETIVVLLHAQVPGAESYHQYEELLHATIMEISESWTNSSWYSGIEFIIWSLVIGDRTHYEFSEFHHPFSLSPEEKSEWLFLAKKAHGWHTYETFLTLEAWNHLYQSQRA